MRQDIERDVSGAAMQVESSMGLLEIEVGEREEKQIRLIPVQHQLEDSWREEGEPEC